MELVDCKLNYSYYKSFPLKLATNVCVVFHLIMYVRNLLSLFLKSSKIGLFLKSFFVSDSFHFVVV